MWLGTAGGLYRDSRDRKAEQAEALLGVCRGFLHADGYAGFNGLYEVDPKRGEPRLVEVACRSHARRKVYDVHVETGAPLAKEVLERIAELFAIETGINGRSPTERVAVRQVESVPRLAISNESFELRSERSVPRARSLARSVTLCRAGTRSRTTPAMADWR